MSEAGSKFGMLRTLTQGSSEAAKQEDRKAEKQKPTPAAEQQSTVLPKQPSEEVAQGVELKHYSSYMPVPLFAQLQIYVAKKKATRGNTGGKVSMQSVIAEAVQQYLDRHDR